MKMVSVFTFSFKNRFSKSFRSSDSAFRLDLIDLKVKKKKIILD